MNNDNEVWVLEYSDKSYKIGHHPLHIDLKKNSNRNGSGPGNWKVIFTGTHDEVVEACEKKSKELGL